MAASNVCSSEDMLRDAYFALEDAARTWFESQERALTRWHTFCIKFLARLTNVVHKERAKAMLEIRVQLPDGIMALFTEEMRRLIHHADSGMPKDRKVHFLMSEVRTLCGTKAESMKQCRRICVGNDDFF